MRRRPASRTIACGSWARHRSHIRRSSPAGPSTDTDTARHGLPSRQMTTVHLAGLGEYEAVDSRPLLLRQRRRRPLLGAAAVACSGCAQGLGLPAAWMARRANVFRAPGGGRGGGEAVSEYCAARWCGTVVLWFLGDAVVWRSLSPVSKSMGCAFRFFSSQITTARLRPGVGSPGNVGETRAAIGKFGWHGAVVLGLAEEPHQTRDSAGTAEHCCPMLLRLASQEGDVVAARLLVI